MRPYLVLALAFLLVSPANALNMRGGGSRVPAAARAAGYLTNTFSTESNFAANTVDTGLTYHTGYQWYFWNFFGQAPSSSGTTLNADGSMSVIGSVVSSAKIPTSPFFVGTAFGGGGYFEAEISFDPLAKNPALPWPSWWMMSVEHLVGLSTEQWPGQVAGYDHFQEVDTFEYDRIVDNQYGATLHDWYGQFNVTCSSYCNLATDFNLSSAKVPLGTDWTIFHRVAVLWIPATVSTQGSFTFYFDDIVVGGPFLFSQFTTQLPPPTTATPWAFGVADQQHLTMILSTGWGPLNVKSVNAWQASAAGNLHN